MTKNINKERKTSSYIDGMALELQINEKRKQKIENAPSSKEQSYGRTLAEMGRQAYFVEYLYGIAPMDQNYDTVEGYKYAKDKFTKEEMLGTITFKKGYNYAEAMAKAGVIPDRFKEETKKHR